MALFTLSDLKSKYSLSQKEIASLLNVTRTDVIYLEHGNKAIEIDDKLLPATNDKITIPIVDVIHEEIETPEEIDVPIQRKNYSPAASKYELEMIDFVNNFIIDFPMECKVNKDNAFSLSRKIIGLRIKVVRESKGITVEDISSEFNRTIARHCNIESGRNRLNAVITSEIARYLEVPEIIFNDRLVELEQRFLTYELRRNGLM